MSKPSSTTIVPAADTTPEVVAPQSPAATAERVMDEMRPTVLTVDDATREAILKEAAQSESVVAFLIEKGNVAGTQMLNSQMRLRRLFPASEEVRAILGDDACDLIGQTDAYKEAIKDINAEAFKALVSRLRRDGYGKDIAEATAKARIETVRKNVSVQYRRYVDQVALNTCDNDTAAAAALLLAHGFKHHTAIETKKAPQAIRPGQTLEVLDPKDKAAQKQEGVRNVGQSLVRVVTPEAPAPAEPQRDRGADVTQPNDTAEAKLAALLKSAGISVGDPHAIVNLAIGLLDGAAGLLAGGTKMDNKVRKSLRGSLTSSVRKLVGELESTLPVEEAAPIVK